MTRISTGIEGLDKLLHGGLIPEKVYVISGPPGTGKTTIALHFLNEGARKGERVLMISLTETEESIRRRIEHFGMETSIEILDLTPSLEIIKDGVNLFGEEPHDGARLTVRNEIIRKIEAVKPKRVVVDGISSLRTLHPDVYTYRQQILSLQRYLISESATVMFVSGITEAIEDGDLRLLADGIISTKIDEKSGELKIGVIKYRNSRHEKGYHHMKIGERGIEVYPRIYPHRFLKSFKFKKIPSGISELDEMMRGGVETGTITIVSGPPGVGKSILISHFIKTAAEMGYNSAIYLFEEGPEMVLKRCEGVGIPIKKMVEKEKVLIRRIEPLEYSSEEFSHIVLKDAEERDLKVVVIDSLDGYELSLRGSNLEENLRALGKSLANMGIAVFLANQVEELEKLTVTEKHISYLADNIILLRYIPPDEGDPKIRRRLGILKMRVSDFERRVVEFEITNEGLKIMK